MAKLLKITKTKIKKKSENIKITLLQNINKYYKTTIPQII